MEIPKFTTVDLPGWLREFFSGGSAAGLGTKEESVPCQFNETCKIPVDELERCEKALSDHRGFRQESARRGCKRVSTSVCGDLIITGADLGRNRVTIKTVRSSPGGKTFCRIDMKGSGRSRKK